MASRGVVLLAAMLGGAAALATVKPDANCAIICVDSVNECGEKYGGCYDPCLEAAPEAPACTIPGTRVWYPTPPPTEITPFADGEDEDCNDIIPWNITIPSCPSDADEPAETDGGDETDGVDGTDAGDGTDGDDETDGPVEAVPWQGAEVPAPEEPVVAQPVVGEPVPEDPLIGEPVPDEIVPWIPDGSRGWSG
ncbi:hypothetical protein MKX07_004354 [Trichoderma sp. CBMAI-0711]|uniref:SSCRP protein n=1 Tax=Trichoderma parareesei TaxID=858221 RepID=A0A2H2ZK05_TRIPA|nr:hypothetical protein MKX07_004354 [Trichoderma sp. CBMAI-0711]OTA03510.1 SSCRP protein [Trichoderma parareesei]